MSKEALPTQQLVEIDFIQDGIIVLKTGGLRHILMVSGINFDLKSEEEQNILIYAFQEFLNSLDFSVQFFIHSRKLNIEDYLAKLSQLREQEANELLKIQIGEYREFIRSFVSQNAIMAKTFFAVVPFDPVQIPSAGIAIQKKIFGMFSKNRSTRPTTEEEKSEQLRRNFQQLSQRVDQVIGGLAQIGLRAAPLNNEEVIELFYNLYNPEEVEKKKLEIAKE